MSSLRETYLSSVRTVAQVSKNSVKEYSFVTL